MFEVGQFYFWSSHVVSACFKTESNEDEYASDSFNMIHNGKTIAYKKGIITPDIGSKCKCTKIDPLTFEVEKIVSPLFEEDIKYKQSEVVKKVLRSLGCSTSDLDVQTILGIAIPHNFGDMPVSEDMILKSIVEYLQREVGSTYGGSYMGYTDHENTLTAVLTVLLGHKVAYALMKMNEDFAVSVNYVNKKFVAYYGEEEFESYLNSIGAMVGVRTSAADNMLQDILSSVRNGTAGSADVDDVITFTAWYNALTDEYKEWFRTINPDLAEAAAHNDRVTMKSYGSSGLRQTMWLIVQTIPLSCDRNICEFYDWMYKHISAEGWNRLSIEFKELFVAVCNRQSIAGEGEVFDRFRENVNKARAVLDKYYNRNGDYCQ